ncbi:DUF983 domain-containing protein [Hyphobacterium marinum]|uniref:DUF983 domain-containing protein n=1 Tax=Hyphobacterium marinum TaxID=3116574 RepID=A0ABU7LY82_9PROT|nr:DUF983 domain-containing protein [Hyphobacterium sp. Y6023]MEE2566516.1 DUF983 domain-containing protein [Hyphobacterium sp. Y6023]
MSEPGADISLPSARTAVWRAVRGRCPRCGKGRLFIGYVKPARACDVCDEPVGDIRAEDGPSWLTILMTGPVVLPVVFTLFAFSGWPDWAIVGTGIVLAVGSALCLLPRVKGGFIGVLWLSKNSN